MDRVYSGQECHERHKDLSSWLVRRLTIRHMMLAAAVLMLASFHSTTRAYAQEQDVASCEDKCNKDEKQCLYNGSSEELCDYDKKMCKKACNEKK